MPHWLVQDPTYVYLVLVIATAGLGFGYWTTRQRRYAAGLAAAIALIVCAWLVDRAVVTDHERIVANVQTMASAVQRRDLDRIFELISPRFKVGGLDKKGFREWCQRVMRQEEVTSLRVWDFTPAEVEADKGTAQIQFMVKGTGTWQRGGEFFRCRAHFVRDSDGEWRLSGFELFEPMKDPKLAEPLPLPQLH